MEQTIEELVKELIELDREIALKINELKKEVVRNGDWTQYIR